MDWAGESNVFVCYLNGNIKCCCFRRSKEARKASALNVPLKTLTVVIELFIAPHLAEKFTIACGEVLTGGARWKWKGNSNPPQPTSVRHENAKWYSKCFMLAVVNFAWRTARALASFRAAPANEASNEKILFFSGELYLPSRLRGPQRMNFLRSGWSWECWLSTKMLCT